MSDFGQSLAPKIYRDQTSRAISRWELAQLLDNALRAVGMLPVRGMSYPGFPAELSATWLDSVSGILDTLTWFYRFPDASTFAVNGVNHIPLVAFHFWFDSTSNPVNGYQSVGFGFQLCIVPESTVTKSALISLTRTHINGTNYGFGSYSTGVTAIYPGQKGAWYHAPGVKPSPNVNYSGTQTLDAVNNIQVSLTKAGLWIFAGSGTRKTDMGNKFAVGFAFGGSRVPGRALDPAQDTYLNGVCPVLLIPLIGQFGAESDIFWNSTTSSPATWSTGFQFNSSRFTLNAVKMTLYAIENMEASIFPRFATPPVASPTKVNGSSRHVLTHVVAVPEAAYGTTTPKYGPVDGSDALLTTWKDVFYFPGMAASDGSLPAGDHVDPDTGKTWFAFLYNRNNQTFAIDLTGATNVTAPADLTLSEDVHMSFVNGVTGPYPKATTVTRSTPASWTTTPGQDELFGAGAAAINQLTARFDVVWPELLPTSRVRLSFEARVRSALTQGANRYGFLQYSLDGGTTWVTAWSLADSGTNTGAPSYNYAAYEVDLPAAGVQAVQFRFGVNDDSATVVTLGLRNVHLKRYD